MTSANANPLTSTIMTTGTKKDNVRPLLRPTEKTPLLCIWLPGLPERLQLCLWTAWIDPLPGRYVELTADKSTGRGTLTISNYGVPLRRHAEGVIITFNRRVWHDLIAPEQCVIYPLPILSDRGELPIRFQLTAKPSAE